MPGRRRRPPQVVRRVLVAAGITPDDGRHTRLPRATVERLADPAWLAAEYEIKSTPQIAEELGCSESAVLRAMRDAGIARRPREEYMPKARGIEPWPSEVVDKVFACYASGKSVQAVAEKLGLGQKRMYRLLQERGPVRSWDDARRVAAALG